MFTEKDLAELATDRAFKQALLEGIKRATEEVVVGLETADPHDADTMTSLAEALEEIGKVARMLATPEAT